MYDNQREGIVRTLSLFFVIWSVFGPIDSSLIEFKIIFLNDTALNSILNSIELFWVLKILLVTTSLALMKYPASLPLSALQMVSGGLFLYLGVVSNSLWNYNTHIIIISILTFVAGLRSKTKSGNNVQEKELITALSLIFATIYYQAALSKMVVSGAEWMNSGLSIYIHLLKFNPALSSLLDGRGILFQVAGWMTVIGELALGTLFIVPKTRKLAAVSSITFHIMLWFTLHISFWHLWIFYPATYFASIIPMSNIRFSKAGRASGVLKISGITAYQSMALGLLSYLNSSVKHLNFRRKS